MTDIVKTKNKSFGSLLDELFVNNLGLGRKEVRSTPVIINE